MTTNPTRSRGDRGLYGKLFHSFFLFLMFSSNSTIAEEAENDGPKLLHAKAWFSGSTPSDVEQLKGNFTDALVQASGGAVQAENITLTHFNRQEITATLDVEIIFGSTSPAAVTNQLLTSQDSGARFPAPFTGNVAFTNVVVYNGYSLPKKGISRGLAATLGVFLCLFVILCGVNAAFGVMLYRKRRAQAALVGRTEKEPVLQHPEGPKAEDDPEEPLQHGQDPHGAETQQES
uniref:Uncharacterized protein n=1 Tax=Tetraselmis sp. GSL018 TaxID=582737 RepID=A0A061R0W7_9CHLO|mmetsp:Transcript_14840/g.35358  ORF Transcript_14840/g.35358 Transcript_14840/m.35358 type:complete len:233 (-) Transcript_14840:185-883(-)